MKIALLMILISQLYHIAYEITGKKTCVANQVLWLIGAVLVFIITR